MSFKKKKEIDTGTGFQVPGRQSVFISDGPPKTTEAGRWLLSKTPHARVGRAHVKVIESP